VLIGDSINVRVRWRKILVIKELHNPRLTFIDLKRLYIPHEKMFQFTKIVYVDIDIVEDFKQFC